MTNSTLKETKSITLTQVFLPELIIFVACEVDSGRDPYSGQLTDSHSSVVIQRLTMFVNHAGLDTTVTADIVNSLE